ncbi:hypothetical protein C1S82_13060 [Mycolicibacterium cosmeticum]|nr:hypothetical protein C1S82_13060 [Mycolicibacterium cosmeticum]
MGACTGCGGWAWLAIRVFTLRLAPSAVQRLLALVCSVKLDPARRCASESLLDPRADGPL